MTWLDRHLNIVSFDVPWPPDYGGVIDVYYKVWWLHQAGVKVHLHCFAYGRNVSPELERICASVTCYPRKTGFLANLSLVPYTVASRRSKKLRENLLANEHPILFEVLHTCWLLRDPALKHRVKIFRHSNIEHEYYRAIARKERGFFRKLFHYLEAVRLRRFEPVVRHAQLILAVNEKDAAYFSRRYPEVPCSYLPSFHAHEKVEIASGKGDFALFQGNLSVSENYDAAVWLITNVLAGSGIRAVFAGRRPPAFLAEIIGKHNNIRLVADPDEATMRALTRDAQVHLLYTGQATGLRLKLLHTLFTGRFVLCNGNMLAGTGISADQSIRVAEEAKDFRKELERLMVLEMVPQFIEARRGVVARFGNEKNARNLIAAVFGDAA